MSALPTVPTDHCRRLTCAAPSDHCAWCMPELLAHFGEDPWIFERSSLGEPREALTAEQIAVIFSEIDQQIRFSVAAYSKGQVHRLGFVEAMLKRKADKAAQRGLILTAANTADGWTVVRLYVPRQPWPCASLAFQATTGRFHSAGSPRPANAGRDRGLESRA